MLIPLLLSAAVVGVAVYTDKAKKKTTKVLQKKAAVMDKDDIMVPAFVREMEGK